MEADNGSHYPFRQRARANWKTNPLASAIHESAVSTVCIVTNTRLTPTAGSATLGTGAKNVFTEHGPFTRPHRKKSKL